MEMKQRLRAIPTLSKADIKRYWSKVERLDESMCWKWLGSLGTGYGMLNMRGVQIAAHRIAYYLHNQVDPGKQFIRRTCGVNACVNPAHLVLDTRRSPNAHLTAEQVDRIKESVNTHSNAELARMFNVATATISNIRHGKTWSEQ